LTTAHELVELSLPAVASLSISFLADTKKAASTSRSRAQPCPCVANKSSATHPVCLYIYAKRVKDKTLLEEKEKIGQKERVKKARAFSPYAVVQA